MTTEKLSKKDLIKKIEQLEVRVMILESNLYNRYVVPQWVPDTDPPFYKGPMCGDNTTTVKYPNYDPMFMTS